MPRAESKYHRRGVKLTQHQCYVFDKLKDGERIVCTHGGEAGVEYSLQWCGYTVRADTFEALKGYGFLEALPDSLIDNAPQFWRLAPYAETRAA